MKSTIDKAGRVVIPRDLRDKVGLQAGDVEITADGVGIRIEPLAGEGLVEVGGRLAIPASGTPIDDDLVRKLRDADRK
jgi:AbrB family looped-hinge helix DNA binding protein